MLHLRLSSSGFNYDWHSLMEKYRSHVTPDSHVLEIGSSVEARTLQLASYCKTLTGVELHPERIPQAGSNISYIQLDWQKLSAGIEPHSIDVAVASHVIEHVPDDLKAVNELYTVLRPGGVGILNTPNRERMTRKLIETVTGPRRFPYWEHIREYTERDLTALLQKSSFTRWQINGLVLGIHGGPIFLYLDRVPPCLRRYSNYWEIILYR